MRAKCFIVGVFCLLIAALPTLPQSYAPEPSSQVNMVNILKAVSYLVDHYNPSVGLVYESEDTGQHWLARTEYPGYHWSYDKTYWLYSDNLEAIGALQPYRPDIAKQINDTFNSYHQPPSGKFEALFGTPVGPDRGAYDLIVNQTKEATVLIRIHNGTIGSVLYHYADNMAYQALSMWYLGRPQEARVQIRSVLNMWNGTCVLDSGMFQTTLNPGNAPSDIQTCTQMKIAVTLYAARVIGVEDPKLSDMERFLWSTQQSNGGITTLSKAGKAMGSANTETTSLTLLIYNDALISRLKQKGRDAFMRSQQATVGTFESSMKSLTDRWHIDQPNDLDTFTALFAILVVGVTAVSLAALFYILKKHLWKHG